MSRMWSNFQRKLHFAKYNLMPFRPSLIASHMTKRLASKLGLQQGFRIIDLALTYRCNLKCKHCSALVLEQDKQPLNLEDYQRIVKEAEQLGILSWNITGGEPLLIKWLDELIPILKPKKHYISVQTNCLLLTEKRAKQLASLGINCITTSIDSSDPDEHNKFRGSRYAYEKTFQGIANAQKAGMQTLIGGTVTHQNLRSDGLKRLIEQANQVGAIFLFNLAVPCGSWKGKYDMILQGDDREYLQYLMDIYPRTSTDHEVGRNAVGCPAGMEKIYITPYGEVIPCPFIHVSFGNVRHTPLPEIISKMRKVPYFGKYQPICIAAEDREFHKQVIDKVYDLDLPLPVPHTEIF
jgi:MoaA/NifB/PqqE/SkfB family radical SAM enzyme